MLDKAKLRFKNYDNITFISADITSPDFKTPQTDIAILFLTLQFIEPSMRQYVLSRTAQALKPNGTLILVEKVDNDHTHKTYTKLYHQYKNRQGYTKQEIEAKAEALKGILTPVSVQSNELYLDYAGLKNRDLFWKWLNFAAWTAQK
jgi:tRNA (cmo5U34)-methyltransferase